MIQDRRLCYDGSQSDWTSFEFQNVTLNTLAIAVLATLFSYQAASIAHDLLFGFKSAGQAKARDLHILLLTRQSSPLAIVSSLLRQDWLSRKRFTHALTRDDTIAREEERIRLYVVAKLLLVIISIPIVNMLAIVASFGESERLTFSDVKFGGIALGLNMNNSVQMTPPTWNCQAPTFLLRNTDSTDASFSICVLVFRGKHESDPIFAHGRAFLQVASLNDTFVTVTVHVNGCFTAAAKIAELYLPGGPQDLRNCFSQASAETLAKYGMELLAKECRVGNFNVSAHIQGVQMINTITCPVSDRESRAVANKVAFGMLEKVTLVESNNFEVQKNSAESAFEHADDYNFLVRKAPYLSLAEMAIVTAVTISIRALLKLILKNDLGEGVHRLVKRRLGLLCWDSLLRTEARNVSYFRDASGAKS